MKYIFLIGVVFLLVCPRVTFAQEHRISTKKVPKKIQAFVQTNYSEAGRIKYYQDIEHDTLFIECEFKLGDDQYALQFLHDSLFEVEIYIPFKEIPASVSGQIETELSNRFKKYKIQECFEVNPSTHLQYEINIKGTGKQTNGFYELFFDRTGQFILIREIIFKPITTVF